MAFEDKLDTLLSYIDESIRKKVFCKNFFIFFLLIKEEFVELRILNTDRFQKLYEICKDHLWKEFLRSHRLKDKISHFLMNNSDIANFIERNNMDHSIIFTDLKCQFERFEEMDPKSTKFHEKLEDNIDFLESEINAIIKFKDIILDTIKKKKTCFKCEKIATYQCPECGKSLCEEHNFSGHCTRCARNIIEKNSKDKQ